MMRKWPKWGDKLGKSLSPFNANLGKCEDASIGQLMALSGILPITLMYECLSFLFHMYKIAAIFKQP